MSPRKEAGVVHPISSFIKTIQTIKEARLLKWGSSLPRLKEQVGLSPGRSGAEGISTIRRSSRRGASTPTCRTVKEGMRHRHRRPPSCQILRAVMVPQAAISRRPTLRSGARSTSRAARTQTAGSTNRHFPLEVPKVALGINPQLSRGRDRSNSGAVSTALVHKVHCCRLLPKHHSPSKLKVKLSSSSRRRCRPSTTRTWRAKGTRTL